MLRRFILSHAFAEVATYVGVRGDKRAARGVFQR